MTRALFLLSVIGLLLGACSRSPVAPVEKPGATPATMSTDQDDAAIRVVADAKANTYVLGKSGSRSFLNRYKADGVMDWHTEPSFPSCAEGCELLNLQLVQDKLYTFSSSFNGSETDTETLSFTTFDLFGKELSSYPVKHTGDQIAEAAIGAKTKGYVLSQTSGDHPRIWYLDAFDAQGQTRWSKTIRFPTTLTNYTESGVSLSTALDGSVYLAGIGNLSKYSADGTLQWAREFPFSNQTHLREYLVVGKDISVYYLRELTLADIIPFNVEIKRFDAGGNALWTKTLIARDAASQSRDLSVGNLAVDPSGALFLVSNEIYEGKNLPYVSFNALYKITPDAQISVEEGTLESGKIYDLAFAPFEEGQPAYVNVDAKVSYLFTAGSSFRGDSGGRCYDPEDESTGSPYCPDADAFLTKYRLFSSDYSASSARELVWLRY